MADTKNTTNVGNIGEDIAAEWLQREGYQVIARNYAPKIAEIDIIAYKNKRVHFVEVKSVSHETREAIESRVSYETYQPEDLVDKRKFRKLQQGIEVWLHETGFRGEYQLDVLVVKIAFREEYATIKALKNVVL